MNNSKLPDIKGEWAISKELAAAPIVGISNEETAGLIGDKLSINEQEIQFQNQTCTYSRVEKNEQTLPAVSTILFLGYKHKTAGRDECFEP